jgi:hypothetical protein
MTMEPPPLPDILNWVPIIRQAYEINARYWREQSLEIERIGGGGNNALFKVTQGDVSYLMSQVEKRFMGVWHGW